MGFQHPIFEASPGVCHSFAESLFEDSAAFEKAAKTKDFSSTMKAFQALRVGFDFRAKPLKTTRPGKRTNSLRTGKWPFIVDIPIYPLIAW
jgi:hypothetical protein